MQINVSAKHVTLTPAIEEYAQKKAEKLLRYFDRVQSVAIVIDKHNHEFSTEIIADVEHHDAFIAHSTHDDLYAAIDLGMDRSARQLKDHKSKLRDSKHNLPTSGNEK